MGIILQGGMKGILYEKTPFIYLVDDYNSIQIFSKFKHQFDAIMKILYMTIKELHQNYSQHDLSYFPGDRNLRFELFSPIFNNLFENKVVYHERFTGIIQLENITLTPERFEATAVPLLQIVKGSRLDKFYPKKPWGFSAVWEHIRLIDTCLNSVYGGWNIWCDPETVKRVEELVKEEKYKEALDLTLYINS